MGRGGGEGEGKEVQASKRTRTGFIFLQARINLSSSRSFFKRSFAQFLSSSYECALTFVLRGWESPNVN